MEVSATEGDILEAAFFLSDFAIESIFYKIGKARTSKENWKQSFSKVMVSGHVLVA